MEVKPTKSCNSPSKPTPLPTGQAQRAHDLLRIIAISCRSPAFLHEQVSKRPFWTAATRARSKEIISRSCCTRP